MAHPNKPKTRINRAKAIAGQSTILYENLIEFLNPGMVAAFKAYLDSGDSEAAAAIATLFGSQLVTTAGFHAFDIARDNLIVVDLTAAAGHVKIALNEAATAKTARLLVIGNAAYNVTVGDGETEGSFNTGFIVPTVGTGGLAFMQAGYIGEWLLLWATCVGGNEFAFRETSRALIGAQRTTNLLEAFAAWDPSTGDIPWWRQDSQDFGNQTSTPFSRGLLQHADETAFRGGIGAAPLASPTFTGTPAAPTASQGTNTTQLATTAFVRAEVAALVNSATSTLDTLGEIATALGNDPNLATTLTTALGNRLRFDAAQSLSGGQQTQLRTNAGLGTLSTLNTAAPANITFANTARLLGRASGGGGTGEEISLGNGLALFGSTLTAQGTYLLGVPITAVLAAGLGIAVDFTGSFAERIRHYSPDTAVNEGDSQTVALVDCASYTGASCWEVTVCFHGHGINSNGAGTGMLQTFLVVINHDTDSMTYSTAGAIGVGTVSLSISFSFVYDTLFINVGLQDYSTGGVGHFTCGVVKLSEQPTF